MSSTSIKDRREELEDKFKKVCSLLEMESDIKSHVDWAISLEATSKVDPNFKLEFYCYLEYYRRNEKPKFTVKGLYPETKRGEEIKAYNSNETKKDSIGISIEKTSEQITKDIIRRLYPEYKERLSQVLNKIKQCEKNQDSIESDWNYLEERTGFKTRNLNVPEKDLPSNRQIFEYDAFNNGNSSLEINHWHDNTFKISIDKLSKEQIALICNILKADKFQRAIYECASK